MLSAKGKSQVAALKPAAGLFDTTVVFCATGAVQAFFGAVRAQTASRARRLSALQFVSLAVAKGQAECSVHNFSPAKRNFRHSPTTTVRNFSSLTNRTIIETRIGHRDIRRA